MTLPGFSAQAALLGSRCGYQAIGQVVAGMESRVQPQAPKGGTGGSTTATGKCQATCYGTYIGSTLGCALDANPDICRSIAENVYGRCNTGCAANLSGGSFGIGFSGVGRLGTVVAQR